MRPHRTDRGGRAGPFRVTAPNTALSWAAGSTETVTWDVAGTTAAPSMRPMSHHLSLDGGTTWPIELAASTPTTAARPAIPAGTPPAPRRASASQAVGNVFFDVSDANFSITGGRESGGSTSVTEGGASDSYTVVLNSQPNANVGINIVFDPAQLILNGDTDGSLSLQFTPGNWQVPQTVTVGAVDDTLVEANPHSSLIVQTVSSSDPAYALINPADVTVSIAENDFQQISFVSAGSSVGEAAGTHVASARLNIISNGTPGGVISSDMTASVTLTLGTAEASDISLVTTSLTFPAGSAHNSTLPITLTVFNDRLLEGNETGALSLALVTSVGSVSGTHVVTVIDDEVGTISFTAAGSATSESAGTHSGAIGRLTIAGTGSGPLASEASVSVAITDASGTATTPADYAVSTSTLVFPANAPSPVDLPIAISIANDVLIENVESFSLGFGAISGAGALSGAGTHVVSIADNDLAQVGFAPGNDSVSEGDGSFSKPVVLGLTADGVGTPSLQNALLVPVGFTEGTALEPEDFTLATASVSFAAGSLDGAAQDATVNLTNDPVSEPTESFELTLGNGFVTPNITLGRAATTVTITDDDIPGITITQSGGGNAVSEDGATDTYSIVLDSQPTATVNVAISFPADEVTVNGDTDGTYNTTFTAGNWSNAQTITLAAVNDRTLEGDHSASLVHAFVSSDANYNGITATIDGGASSNTLSVAITDNETAELRWSPGSASAAEGSNASSAVVLDITADPPGGTPTLEGTISYTLTPTFGTAVAADLGTITGPLSFTNVSDLASNAISIPHLADALVEGEEQYSLAITLDVAPAGTSVASAPFVGTIVDANSATVSLSGSATVGESVGSSGLTVSLNTAAGNTLANPVSVAIDLTDGTATYAGGSGDFFFAGPSATATVTFPAGSGNAATRSVSVSIRDDALVENSESFSASLGAVTGAASASGGPAVIAITDNESAVVGFQSPTSAVSEGSTPHSVNALLTITAVGTGTPALAVPISAAVTQTPGTAGAADYTLSTTSISFTAGTPSAATQPIAITIIDDLIAEGSETFSLGFGAVTGPATASGSHTVTLIDNDTAGVVITESAGATSVAEGGSNDTYTLALTSQPVGNVTIAINPSSQLTAAPTSLTFTGSTWNVAQEVTVAAVDDAVVEGDHGGTLSHVVSSGDPNYNGLAVAPVDVAITDNDDAVVSFSPISVSQTESSSPMMFTVTLSNPVQSGVTLSVNSAFGTATAADFTPVVSGTVSFAPNSTASQTVSVAITNDALDENDESFTLVLSNLLATGDVSLGDAVATGTILDDDPSPTLSISSPSQPEGNSGTTPMNFVVSLSTVSGRDVMFTRATQDGTATAANNDYVPLTAAQATIPAGELSISIPVLINGDTSFEGDETFSLNITGVINATPTSPGGIGTIEDDDQQPTTTTIVSNLPDPSLVGQAYTVSVSVSAQSLSPLGTVMVSDGTDSCGPISLSPGTAPDSSGSCELTSSSAGAKLLTASYTPAGTDFAASSGTRDHQVDPASTSISVSGPANSRLNQPVSFGFALDVVAPGGGTPSGTVTLSTAGSSCQVTVPSATPACDLQFGTLGPAAVSASYAPDDGDHLVSTSSGAGNAQTLVFALTDLQVTKTAVGGTYLDGDLLVYTVTLRNLGEDTAVDLLLSDEVPAGLVDVLWTCDSSGGLVCPQSNGSGDLDEAIPVFPVGGLLNYSFYGNVDGNPSQIVNTASVSLPADGRVQDPNPANNSATAVSLNELLFADGFEAPLVTTRNGSYALPMDGLRGLLDDVARILFVLDDANGHAARVYARVHAGQVQYALAERDEAGRLRLGTWLTISGDPQISWSARDSARGWVVEAVELR
jgi:uncharacterized repeat protein (TIGR01451 family)